MDAYRHAVAELTPEQLTTHYTDGLQFFHGTFVPRLKSILGEISGGVLDLTDLVAYAAGSDVDLMTHVVGAVAAEGPVHIYPGDWFGFKVGCAQQERIRFDARGEAALACLCIPSVRNGHLTEQMLAFLATAPACLLNLNLYPTLRPAERRDVATRLAPIVPNSLLSISFSRGFGLTASQLGVLLVHRDHPLRARFDSQWTWLTYFHNAIAARAFLALDLQRCAAVDDERREWVSTWLADRSLPDVGSGSYYVRTFRVEGELDYLTPLARDGLVRLCFKPPHS